MPTGNLDEPSAPIASQPAPPTRFRLPADYYSAPLSEVRPVLPRWAPYGCGALAAAFLVLLFVGGALLTGPRFAAVLDLVIGTSLGEVRSMYAPEITDAQKERFDAEVKRMREDLRQTRVSVQQIRPFLQTMQKAIADQKVTPEELGKLTEAAAEAKPTKR